MRIDGEPQLDAARVASVAAAKTPGSDAGQRGQRPGLPSLGAGNVGYKIAERIGGAMALGPILQGLSAPLNDRTVSTDIASATSTTISSGRSTPCVSAATPIRDASPKSLGAIRPSLVSWATAPNTRGSSAS